MVNFLFVLIAAAVIFVLLWIGLYRKSKAKAAVSYSCSVCNEKHCNCTKTPPDP